jgi:hypothetical protein
MKIEGDDSLEACTCQQVRGKPSANRFPPICPAILTRISEARNCASKTGCTCPPTGVSEEEQFHQVTVHRRTSRLNHVDVAAAHAFFYLCVQLGVRKTVQNRAADSGSEPLGNRVGKRRVSGRGYNNEIHISSSANLYCSFAIGISRANLASSAGNFTSMLKFDIDDTAGDSDDPGSQSSTPRMVNSNAAPRSNYLA